MSHAAADPPGVPPRRLPAVEERSAGGVVVDVHEGDTLDEDAFADLVRAAVALNRS